MCSYYNASKVRASDTGITTITSGDEIALRAAVALVGPVSIALDASEFKDYKSGEGLCEKNIENVIILVFFLCAGILDTDACCDFNNFLISCLNHAVLVSFFLLQKLLAHRACEM